MTFPTLSKELLEQRLRPPTGKIRMVLDTDTYNEIDDQFAVAYAMCSPEKLTVEAIYAAPFLNERSTGPGDGMVKSYEEILRLLERLHRARRWRRLSRLNGLPERPTGTQPGRAGSGGASDGRAG